jgi:hypothetical protein
MDEQNWGDRNHWQTIEKMRDRTSIFCRMLPNAFTERNEATAINVKEPFRLDQGTSERMEMSRE